MTRRFASLGLILFSMLSSVVFADFEPTFKRSKEIWEQLKTHSKLEYQYSTEYQSWVGLGQTTSISVRGSTIIGRSFELWTWYYDYSDNNSYKRETKETWTEDSKDIGTHDEGEIAKNLDQVYSECESKILGLDADTNTIEFKVDEHGLIKTCRARSIYCADDCWEGIDIVKLEFKHEQPSCGGLPSKRGSSTRK